MSGAADVVLELASRLYESVVSMQESFESEGDTLCEWHRTPIETHVLTHFGRGFDLDRPGPDAGGGGMARHTLERRVVHRR